MTWDQKKFTDRLPDPASNFGNITEEQRAAVAIDMERWRLANKMMRIQDDQSIRRYLRGLSDQPELKQDMNRRFVAIKRRGEK